MDSGEDNMRHACTGSAATMRKGETELDFAFNDLDDKPVSIKDDRFKNK